MFWEALAGPRTRGETRKGLCAASTGPAEVRPHCRGDRDGREAWPGCRRSEAGTFLTGKRQQVQGGSAGAFLRGKAKFRVP